MFDLVASSHQKTTPKDTSPQISVRLGRRLRDPNRGLHVHVDLGLSECFFLFCSGVNNKVLVICTEAPLSTKYILFVHLKMCFTHVFASCRRTHPSNTTCSVAIAMMFLGT